MSLDPRACYRALRTRDARFDGRFFTAVRTTGIYCRPVCPAPTPKLEHCLFLPSAAAAQRAGFRPCLRCRPESAPGTPAWQGSATSVSRALRLIDEGALDGGTVDALAQRLGLGERQLRRLFLQHVGASPNAVAQTRRVALAKKLISETSLSMQDVAFAAGFSSVRRFNDAMRETYHRSPSELRRHDVSADATGRPLRVDLCYRPPLHWPTLLDYLALRATPGVESVTHDGYVRTLRLGAYTGVLRATPRPELHRVELELCGISSGATPPLLDIIERVRRLFDLSADPEPIAAQLDSDADLCRIVSARPGVRIPGAWDRFELCVRAILGQQVSVRGATTLAGRLAKAFGETILPNPSATQVQLSFPTPERLVDAPIERIGIPQARAQTIRSLASALLEHSLRLDHAGDLEQSVAELCRIPGIGPWTAHYVALRALGEPDAFPCGDLGLRKALSEPGAPPLTPRALEARAAEWRPWRGYAALYLWTEPATRNDECIQPRNEREVDRMRGGRP